MYIWNFAEALSCSTDERAAVVQDALRALRAGLHCAPFAHKTVGTLPDGTVRLSVSAFNRESEIDTFLSSLRAIAAGQAKN